MEQEWVDFRLIKSAVSMQMLIDRYDLKGLRKSSGELRGRCPIHRGEGERTFHVNLSKGVFQCFSCKAKGNVLDFVAALEHCNIREAALKLQSWFVAGESDQASTETRVEQTEESPADVSINPVLPFTLRVDASHEYGLSRGLRKETLEHFGAGLCISKGTFSGRFVIPLHNEHGELVGYAGRSLDDTEPRYLFPSREKGFYKSRLLFNLHRVVEANNKPLVVLVEGFFSAMRLWQAGIGVVSLLGSSLSEAQEESIRLHFSRVVLLLDDDDAGKAGTNECLVRLGRGMWVRVISLPQGYQPDQLPIEEIQTMLVSL